MEFIAIGRISKPIGIRGEVKIVPLTDDITRFDHLQSVWIGKKATSTRQHTCEAVRGDTSSVVMKMGDIRNAEEAEQLRDEYLFIQLEDRIKLQNGTYFVDDIIGCEVVTEEQKKIGIVSDLLKLPGDDVWVVRNRKREFLIPAVKEIVRSVDVEKKRITIRAFEGLIDAY